MRLFDAVVIVDWSAASVPRSGRDSIWVGTGRWRGERFDLAAPANPSTRRAAELLIAELLRLLVADGARVLVGFDFPYGYPRGFASALGLPDHGAPWRAIWDQLRARTDEGNHNTNNRFQVASELNALVSQEPGPFWGCPASQETRFLTRARKGLWGFPYRLPDGRVLGRIRETERRLAGVQEAWKLLGAGSVGSQALLGIPCVARLRGHPQLEAFSRVWPFETGFTATPSPGLGPFVLHAEIWPGAVALDHSLHAVRDAAQVLTLARHAAERDAAGTLGTWLESPRGLDEADLRACTAEEGWILGA